MFFLKIIPKEIIKTFLIIIVIIFFSIIFLRSLRVGANSLVGAPDNVLTIIWNQQQFLDSLNDKPSFLENPFKDSFKNNPIKFQIQPTKISKELVEEEIQTGIFPNWLIVTSCCLLIAGFVFSDDVLLEELLKNFPFE